MRSLKVLIMFLGAGASFAADPPLTGPAETVGGSIFCVSYMELERWLERLASGDPASWKAFEESKRCAYLADGKTVYVERIDRDYGMYIRFSSDGVSYYTTLDGLRAKEE